MERLYWAAYWNTEWTPLWCVCLWTSPLVTPSSKWILPARTVSNLFDGTNQAATRQQIDETSAYFTHGDLLVLQNKIRDLGHAHLRRSGR